MALTQKTTLDVVNQSSTISFYESASLVDQITYSTSGVTFQAISTYNLSKSDLLLYIQYKIAWNSLLFTNFPTIGQSIGLSFPVSNFSLTQTFAGVTHITYSETSGANTIITINYVPTAASGSFTARASAYTVTLQEFFMNIIMLQQMLVQVRDN